jgi:hypothetical protein
MSDAEIQSSDSARPRRSALMIALGTGLVILSLGGVLLLALTPTGGGGAGGSDAADSDGVPVQAEDGITHTPTRRVTPSATPSATLAGPVTPTRAAGTAEPESPDATRAPAVESAPPDEEPSEAAQPTINPDDIPEIEWTQEEKNALSWMCYGEVGGMAGARVDACLSVISTVRARYVYANSFYETDVISTLTRPGQFNVEIHTDRPAPDDDLMWAVEQYEAGARGSCNAFLYFDSVPGGPSLCQIYSSNGWIEFHNGW